MPINLWWHSNTSAGENSSECRVCSIARTSSLKMPSSIALLFDRSCLRGINMPPSVPDEMPSCTTLCQKSHATPSMGNAPLKPPTLSQMSRTKRPRSGGPDSVTDCGVKRDSTWPQVSTCTAVSEDMACAAFHRYSRSSSSPPSNTPIHAPVASATPLLTISAKSPLGAVMTRTRLDMYSGRDRFWSHVLAVLWHLSGSVPPTTISCQFGNLCRTMVSMVMPTLSLSRQGNTMLMRGSGTRACNIDTSVDRHWKHQVIPKCLKGPSCICLLRKLTA
mmetsp:Transcript_100833/g.291576  ORF Transcript_100833/g.291576 Transcript_100833/m.291576 type:complete len:276 (+) Transcript_100833:401-1228(+)